MVVKSGWIRNYQLFTLLLLLLLFYTQKHHMNSHKQVYVYILNDFGVCLCFIPYLRRGGNISLRGPNG